MTAFVKGLAWVVAFLSGVATLFALFGGQQWLEAKGWTLAPDTNVSEEITDDTTDAEATESATDQETDPDEDTAAEADSKTSDLGSIWAAMSDWSGSTFDNLFWGIAAIGFSMLVSGWAGALFSEVEIPINYFVAFLQWVLIVLIVAALILMGILLHGADSGYLVWFIVLTVISAPLGYFVHEEFG